MFAKKLYIYLGNNQQYPDEEVLAQFSDSDKDFGSVFCFDISFRL